MEIVQQQPDEECSSGTIGWRIYLEYYKAGSGIFKGLALIILLIIAEGASVACDWWLAHW